jgi:hypothetical protein
MAHGSKGRGFPPARDAENGFAIFRKKVYHIGSLSRTVVLYS